jgi:penicillin-binding protein 2
MREARDMTVRKKRRYPLELKKIDPEDMEVRKILCSKAGLFMGFMFIVILARLWQLQVLEGERFAEKARTNREKIVFIQPPRGQILDAKGRLLAGVEPGFDICIVRNEVENLEETLRKLSSIIKTDEAEIRPRLVASGRHPNYLPFPIIRNADWETVCRIEAHGFELPGIRVETRPGRKYPYGPVAPHLIGYLGEISKKELESNRFPHAFAGDMVGKRGIEARYEIFLAGEKGKKTLEITARKQLKKVLSETKPVSGKNIYLTIDLDLQQAAEQALEGMSGAAVVIEPSSGRILAIASSPIFDPELFADRISTREWKILNDPLMRPLFDKAMQGEYPPGSTFKIVMAGAALQEHIVGTDDTFFCNGKFKLGRRTFRCWDWRGHGKTNIIKAITESCDVFFYNVGLKLGIDRISRYADMFGLGKKTGIDLPGERPGLVPSREWKLRHRKEAWQKGETLNTSIGQGHLLVTPLQMAHMTAAVANGGRLYKPVFLQKVTETSGKIISRFHPESQGRLPVSRRNLAIIQKGLEGVVAGRHGTARICRIPGLPVAGKTGTAQVFRQTRRRQSEKMEWKYQDHAWFVAYAPADKPALAVAVLIEHGGHGGSAAAPVAKKIFERWLQLQRPVPEMMPARSASLEHSHLSMERHS